MDSTSLPFLWADVPAHVSYVLIAISYWLSNIYWLRITAVVGLALEIVYFRMSGGALHTGIGWDLVFILINVYQIHKLVAEERSLTTIQDVHLLRQGPFSGFDKARLARLVTTGSWRNFEPRALITEEGKPVSELVLICNGHAAVEAHGRLIAYLHGGSFIGEMAFVSGNPASATVTAETSLRAFVFDMEKLRSLIGKDDLLSMALHRVVGRDLAQKLAQQA